MKIQVCISAIVIRVFVSGIVISLETVSRVQREIANCFNW